MNNRSARVKQVAALFVALSCMAVSSMGGADSVVEKKAPSIADQTLFFAPVPKAVCGPGDNPETALQGQVPAAMRAAGFQGFSCNLQLIGQVKGEGANWQSAEWREGKGATKKVCAYHGTAAPDANPGLTRTNLGVRVIDITDPTNPTNTAYLTTTSMLDPWESLKINERRQLLGAVNGANGGGGPQIDIYDVSGDCRHPQLLASTSLSKPDGTPIIGHEGSWAPDGLTYYGADLRYSPAGAVPGNTGQYYAVDTTDTTNPQFITSWQTGVPGANIHGLSVSTDGTRGYMVSLGFGGNAAQLLDPTVAATNGLLIFDLSDIQARKPNPQVKLISQLLWKDGAGAQHTIPVTIGKKPYIIFVDEAGSGGFGTATAYQSACDAGLPPFNMARIIDISDETKPTVVSKLMLETHDPANCNAVLPDVAGLLTFTYGSHYCSVDNRDKATTLACGYFNSGIRVFDIRDPVRPREIAYYNPAGTTTPSPGSNHNRGGGWVAGGPDWCAAALHLDADQGTLWTTCQDNGLLSLKFTHNAWPFQKSSSPASSTPPGFQTN
jgi:hypothetical protein